MKLWQIVIVLLIAGGFIGALIDTAARDYAVERKVDETIALCDRIEKQTDDMAARFAATLARNANRNCPAGWHRIPLSTAWTGMPVFCEADHP